VQTIFNAQAFEHVAVVVERIIAVLLESIISQ
jgi:hypothetical protein